MATIEFTKSEKKAMRILIEKGIMTEYANALAGTEAIVSAWRAANVDERDAYMKLYQHVTKADKNIGRRYSRLSGSNYHFILASQFADELITAEDVQTLPERIQQVVMFLSGVED